MSRFPIIQGGMGVGVSAWPLARAVSRLGQLGVVSGTGLAVVLARRLQKGDPEGHLRRALEHFPVPAVAERVLARYFRKESKPVDEPFKLSSQPTLQLSRDLTDLTVLANFAEVFLAREGHAGAVGINYLEKIQLPTLASIFGAMLAGVGYVLMGAGIPRFIPGALDALAQGTTADLRIDVEGAQAGETFVSRFDPADFFGGEAPKLQRPQFLAIVSSATLALTLARKSNGKVDGFIIEGPTAGGHNAPPRGPTQRNERGEPIYGVRDQVDLAKFRELGLPFWLAGGYAEPARLREAREAGAEGVQVGTAFAFCEESGIDPALKRQVVEQSLAGTVSVFTDPAASPTGFPFKVLQMPGTVSDPQVYNARERICDLGYLRQAYRKPDGTIGHRCAAEPVETYVAKGGDPADTIGRKCICNALFGTIGLSQVARTGAVEPAIITAGDDVVRLDRFMKRGATTYTAADVIDHLLAAQPGQEAAGQEAAGQAVAGRAPCEAQASG